MVVPVYGVTLRMLLQTQNELVALHHIVWEEVQGVQLQHLLHSCALPFQTKAILQNPKLHFLQVIRI